MRVLLATHGTRGDVQPMLALALGLRGRGHDVRLIAPANFVAWIREYGFACESDGVDVETALRRPEVDIHSFRSQMRYFRTLAPQLFEATARAAAGAELVVGAGVQLAGWSVADLIGAPYVGAVFCPCAVPSSVAPPIRVQTLPAWVNRLLWRSGGPVADAFVRGPINVGRVRLGLPRDRRPLLTLARRDTIVAADSELAPLARDAPPATVQTDAWALRERAELDPALEAFLRAGPPPVYIGFGSMIATDLDRLVASVVGAARTCRRRLIVAGGWAALHDRIDAADDVLVIARAPHEALFPRVAAVVHHGGAGTTTAAARAGAPQVILPHLLDQYYWARRIEVLGLGPRTVRVQRVTAEALAAALRQVLDDARFRERAREVGARVAARDGVSAAVDILERVRARAAG